MNFNTTIVKLAGQHVPLDIFQHIIGQKPNVFGLAVQSDDGLNIHRQDITDVPVNELVDDFNAFNENCKDMLAVMHLGNHEKVSEETIPPFLINDPEDNTFIAFFLDGKFTTGMYEYANGILVPKLTELCELVDGAHDKIMAGLKATSFSAEFMSHVDDRGVITLLTQEGAPITIGKNAIGNVYDWGSITNTLAFGAAPAVAEVPKKTGGWGSKVKNLILASTDPVQQPAATATKQTSATPAAPVEQKPSVPQVPVKEVDPDAPIAVRPPGFIHTNDDKKVFYRLVNNGSIPQNFKKGIAVMLHPSVKIPKTMEEFRDMAAELKKQDIAANQKSGTTAGTAPKTGGEIKEARVAGKANLPIMSTKAVDSSIDFVVKTLDGQSGEMDDPRKMQEVESKHKTWSVTHGIDFKDVHKWSVQTIFEYAEKEPEGMAMLFLEARGKLRTAEILETVVKTPDSKTTTKTVTDPVAGTKTVQSESVAAPVVAKKGGWGSKKAA